MFNSRLKFSLLAALTLSIVVNGSLRASQAADAEPTKAPAITHRFLAVGGNRPSQIFGPDGKPEWTFASQANDGVLLPSGNVLLSLYPQKQKYPHGAVVEVTPEGKVVWEWKGTQQEVVTAWPLENGNVLCVELGLKPRLLEVARDGKIAVSVPLTCQTKNVHLETRMARKLPNGNYLVPHLLEKEVREYTPEGKVVWTAHTPNWPFTAIRLDNGHTVVGCTVGNLVAEVDADGKVVWQVGNKDLGSDMINDACGVQRLPNGNTVFVSYHSGKGVKLMEVTPEKKLVWTFNDGTANGIHEFQILETNGEKLTGRVLK
ncbi:MAG: PQQ-like beta-propeller repeat protein [Planctomycetia bacterium]|nr:PQQ-like beta-propeller repeat protein [Planctomycetia bacterium]